MPDFKLRKMMNFVETIHHENGPVVDQPRCRAAIVAIVANPFAGVWQEDLQFAMDDLKPLGLQMTDTLIDALGDIEGIDGMLKLGPDLHPVADRLPTTSTPRRV